MGPDSAFLELPRQLVDDEKARLWCGTCKRVHGSALEEIAKVLRDSWSVGGKKQATLLVSARQSASAAGKRLAAKGASKRGKVRAAVLSPERRREVGRMAIATRLKKQRSVERG